ncbi:MAG: T9SS type A sorting domain-containing protein [Chitinophagales bacterium]
MKRSLLFAFVMLMGWGVSAQCTTTNATSCSCKDGSTNCDLLPNIIVGDEPLHIIGPAGVIEYSQTGNGVENGHLRISVSTPNIGYGSFTVLSSSLFICGTDTFQSNPGTCPDGSSPHNLIYQRIYHKNGSTMTYYDRPAGSMTYHPTHNHMHVDDWGFYTLRQRDTSEPNPLLWPIIGNGAKLGFCLMDFGTCSFYNGQCQDSLGNVLVNSDFPNFGLGGGQYNCSPVEQGISSGYTDIYYQNLDGMYITIPPGTCNGDYYIVVQIDPHNWFLEESETDNVLAIPFTLTKQVPTGNNQLLITSSQPALKICEGTALTLTSTPATTYLWSTGDTTQSISVTQGGTYSVNINSSCGTSTSLPVNVAFIANHVDTVYGAEACEGTPITLGANGSGTMSWFTTNTGGTSLYQGNNYTFTATTTGNYYVEANDTSYGISAAVGPVDTTIGAGGYFSNDQHTVFMVYKPVVLRSVKVFANSTKDRTIELRNSNGTIIGSKTVNLTPGEHTVPLNFYIPAGANYQLGWPIASAPDLYRNTSGANYPYSFNNNAMVITGNSANDTARWYCYYNWIVEEAPFTCASNRVPVLAIVDTAIETTLSALNDVYDDNAASVTLSGTPAGGTFSGAGVSGNVFNPAVAGIGGPYVISYSVLGANGCYGVSTDTVLVTEFGGVGEIEGLSEISVTPIPSDGHFVLSLAAQSPRNVNLMVTDAQGRKVLEENELLLNGVNAKNIDLSNMPKGIYQLTLSRGKQHKTLKLVVQ